MLEYDFESIELTDEQKQLIQLGMGNVDELNNKIKVIINGRSKGGWEPLYPFSVPMLWFKREIPKRNKKA